MQRYYISVILQSRDSKNFIFSLILIFLAELVEPAAGVVGVDAAHDRGEPRLVPRAAVVLEVQVDFQKDYS